MKQKLKLFSLILSSVLLASCASTTPVPTVTIKNTIGPTLTLTATPSPSITPSTPSITPSHTPSAIPLPTNTYTAAPTLGIASNCEIANEQGQIYLLNDPEFRNLRTSDGKLDRTLAAHYPEWANYTQPTPWSTEPVKLGEIIVSASLDEELNLQINPAVTLVTLGESLNWQLPANTDLFSQSREISLTLRQHDRDWTDPQNESLRSQYPDIANGPTYALYAFFNYNLDQLQSWCNTYQRLFETPP